jgi:hypothetical protein
MEKQTGFRGVSTFMWVVIGILTLGAGTLIFWLVFMLLFK